MWWTNIIIVSLLLQSLLITGIDGNANRRRRRRQTSGSLYGTNANLGASAPAGYNYPADTNIQGIRLTNMDARQLYGNPVIPSNTANTLSSVNLYNQPRPQQQQLYGTNDQSQLNSLYSGNSFYSGGNPLLRDPNGNLLPSGSGSLASSFYSSSNNQIMAYPPLSNQVLTTKDSYSASDTNNYPYGYNNMLLPNTQVYAGPMPAGVNNNFLPNSNSYGGPTGTNNNLVPNSNSYSGYMGPRENTNSWPNTNNYNRYNQNPVNAGYRDSNYNYNSRYSNSNPYYNNSYQLTTSFFIIFLSIFAPMVLHL